MTFLKYFVPPFVGVCLIGLFCAWIGGIRPFTEAAGWTALVTVIFAVFAGGIVYNDNQ